MKFPHIIIAIGLIATVAAYLFTAILFKPAITEYDFAYSVTYKLNGETQTFEDVYKCSFTGMGWEGDPTKRYYSGTYLKSEGSEHPGAYAIAEQDGLELRLITTFSNHYLMGDSENEAYESTYGVPYFAVYDRDEVEYTASETLGKFDAEILSYETPEPIENSFVFGGFSRLHDESMVSMLVVGYLVIIACIIFVKRDEGLRYKVLDKVSIAFNFITAVLVIPFILIVVWASQIFASTASLVYQIDLCIPAISAFTVAASLCLRRKGFTRSGIFIQFVGPVFFYLFAVLESILS